MIRVDENVGIAQLDGRLGELDYFDASLRKVLKRTGRKVKKVARSVMKQVKKVIKQPQRLLYAIPVFGQIGYVLKRNKKLRDKILMGFVKAAPFISAAAQLLNLLIPGLGIIVSLAITAASLAIQMSYAKQAKKAMKKAEKQFQAEEAKEEEEAQKDADVKTMAAYDKGEKLFTEQYGVTREDFQASTIEERTKFLNLTIYDIFQPEMTSEGIARDQFQAMPLDQQQDIIAKVGQAAKEVEAAQAKGIPVPQAADHLTPVPDTPVPLVMAPALAEGTDWMTTGLIVGGVALAGVLLLLYAKRKR